MVAEIYTKKKIVDIKKEDDRFDFDYMERVKRIKTLDDLKQLLMDYEEFLPDGLQKFRHAEERDFQLLMDQIRKFFTKVVAGYNSPPSEVTEFVMLLVPPLITLPRLWAQQQSLEKKRRITWGEAFLELSMSGAITKIMQNQESMYKQVIDVVEKQKQKMQ